MYSFIFSPKRSLKGWGRQLNRLECKLFVQEYWTQSKAPHGSLSTEPRVTPITTGYGPPNKNKTKDTFYLLLL